MLIKSSNFYPRLGLHKPRERPLCRHAQIAQARSLQTGDHNRKKDVEKAKAETSERRCELDAAPRGGDAERCKFLAEGAI